MSILVYTESENNNFKKNALEVLSYGKALSKVINEKVICVSFNIDNTDALSSYGADKSIIINDKSLLDFKAKTYSSCISHIAKKEKSKVIILSSSADCKYLAPLLSVQLNASYSSNVVDLPKSSNPLIVKRTCFTNKAFNFSELNSEINIIGVSNNAFGIHENQSKTTVESEKIELIEDNIKIDSTEKITGKATIADADIVISGGRGLKGPENWHLIEDLAEVLGAATACSKPVSDMGWRPHSEHVGQTGKPVASNLYIAIGVSGAIQHIAGINSSKVKVVVNSDPEAPFFKAADYGIIGDAFEVIPELIEKLKAFKN
tara:strand:+ start:10024 stop:10977 length:954 start_codon:yes stop_codon:yes gene_type:complete